MGKTCDQEMSDNQTEDAVTQKLETLIVAGAHSCRVAWRSDA